MTPPFALHLVTLGVTDLKRAIAFYTNLGLPRRDQGSDSVAFFDAGGIVLSLFDRNALALDAGCAAQVAAPGTPSSPESTFSGIALAFNVADETAVARVITQAETAGARVLKPPQRAFWGGFSGYFADPDGHIWEVAHNPFWPLDAAGRPILPE